MAFYLKKLCTLSLYYFDKHELKASTQQNQQKYEFPCQLNCNIMPAICDSCRTLKRVTPLLVCKVI